MKRLFTLIELIVVIVVLGILAAIVIPNVSSFKDEAIRSEVTSNIKNLQTASDRYGLKNDGALPVTLGSSIENPQRIENERLYPQYISKKGSDRGLYWLDHTGAVWGSTVDAPTRVHREGDTLNWQAVPGAKGYQVYGASELDVKGSVDGKTYRYTPLLKVGNEDGKLILGQKVPNADAYDYLLVGSIDRYGLSSVPTGDDYEGYPEQDDFGNFFPIQKEGTFMLTTNAHGKATWDAIVTKEIKPEGTQIKYSFATSDDGKNYTPFTDILTALPQSQYMKVKVEMMGANGKIPTLKSLKVKFHLDEEGENFVVEDTPVEVPVGESFTVIEMSESGYFQEVVIGYREDGYVPSVTYQSSVDGVTYSEPSRYPETLPVGKYLKVTFEAEQSLFVDSIAVIQSPSDPNVAPVEPSPSQREGDATQKPPTQKPPTEGSNPGSGTPEEETEEWVVTSEFEVIEDATNIGNWLSVDKVDTQPNGTKIEYTYYTSQDESSWSGPYSTVDEAPDSRFFKVDMKFMRLKEVGEVASIQELTINYISGGKTVAQKYNLDANGQLVKESKQLQQLELGDVVQFGRHLNGDPIKWNIVKKTDGEVMLFMTEAIKAADGSYLKRTYDDSPHETEPKHPVRTDDGSNNWKYSDIREWLNGEFYETAFENKDVIADTTHDYVLAQIDAAQATSGRFAHTYNNTFSSSLQNYSTAYKNTVTDKVYLVSIDELVNNIHPTIGTQYYNAAYSYWTRDSSSAYSFRVRHVLSYGYVHDNIASNMVSVRPALNLKSGTSVSGDGSVNDPYTIKQ